MVFPRALPVLLGFLALRAGEPQRPVAGELLSAELSLERSLGAGETHRYTVGLAAGEYLRVLVGQSRLDLAVRVRDSKGEVLFEVDNPTGRLEPEVVSLIAESPGEHALELWVPPDKDAASGPYRLSVSALRPAAAEDRQRDEQEGRAFAEADHQVAADSAVGLEPILAYYEKALAAARERGDLSRQAALLHRIGLIERQRNRWPAALEAFEQALALRRRLCDPRGVAGTLDQVGRVSRILSRLDGAREAFSEALALWKKLGETTEEGLACFNLGMVHFYSGEPQKALAFYGEALARFHTTGNRRFEGVALNALGGVHDHLGANLEALRVYGQALQVARELGNRADEADALNSLGTTASRLGRSREALERYAEALEIHRSRGDRRRQGLVLTNLCNLLWELGAPEAARGLCDQALPLVREAGEARNEVSVLLNLGMSAQGLGRHDEAARFLGEALALARRIDDRPAEAQTLLAQGSLQLARGEPRKARESLTLALQRVRELEDRASEPMVLRELGQALAALRDFAGAGSAWEEALVKAGAAGAVRDQALTLQEMARSAHSRKDLGAARGLLERALAHLEDLRAEVSGATLRAEQFAARQEVYEMYVDVLLQLDRAQPGKGLDTLAFEASERGRARGLFDFLHDHQVAIPGEDAALVAQERSLKQQLNAAADRAAATKGDPRAQEELEALVLQRRLLESRIAVGPHPAVLRPPERTLAEIQRHLDDDTVLLEYALGSSRSHLWVVSTTSISTFELPGRARIEELARRVHESLRSPAEKSGREALAALSELVLAPARPLLGKRRLAIVADGGLLYVPWAALPIPGSPGEPLIERYELVSLPSAAVLAELRQASRERPRPAAALALLADPVFEAGDSRLPAAAESPSPGPAVPASSAEVKAREDVERWLSPGGAPATYERLLWSRQEAEAIAAEAGSRQVLLALDFAASRDLALKPQLSRYRILHFATHGLVDGEHPELSGLLLSRLDERGQPREGFLRLHEVYDLRLDADLVVLSGCQTALGRRVRGEGIVGLAHGFFHAGAAQVMASLWSVRDRATAELMQRFYHALFHDGLRPSAALRAAQLSLRRERPWRDPYFWAAFTLQGDWQAGAAGP